MAKLQALVRRRQTEQQSVSDDAVVRSCAYSEVRSIGISQKCQVPLSRYFQHKRMVVGVYAHGNDSVEIIFGGRGQENVRGLQVY